MKQVCTALIFVVLSFSCNTVNTQQASAPQPVAPPAFDPYFVASSDTVATHGPNHITRDLLQDRNGTYWFATWHGIMSYDGKVFTNHTLKENLVRFHVVSCYEDQKGNVWFGTARGGVYVYDGKTFTLFTTKNGLVDNNIYCIAEDKAGNIWFGTDSGASCYNGKTFTSFTTRDGLCGSPVNSILQDKAGTIWFGGGGIACYDGQKFSTFKNEKGEPFAQVLSLFEDKSGNVWIGQFYGLTRYDGKSFAEFLPGFLSYYMTEDAKGNLWLTHSEPNTLHPKVPNQALYKYDGTTFTKIVEKNGPNDFQLFGKMEDNAGNIWFGTMHGPCCYDGKSFKYFYRE